jgi:glycosyltransferase involved in cell wall biosynthesis
MKILQVIHSLNPQAGGTTEAVKQLSAALVRQGIEVDVMTLDAPDAPWLVDFPFPLFALGPGRSSYGYHPQVVPWLVSHADAYDLIVVNGLWQFGNFAVWMASRKTKVRYAVFPHGMLDPWFKRRYPLKHLKKWLYWPWGEYRVLRDADAVLFTSEEERLAARKSFWLYRCREKVIGFGIDAPTADRDASRQVFLNQFPELAGKRFFLFLGRMHEKKGCDLLLRAFRHLASGAGNDLRLVMAGPHDSDYGEEMLRLAHELELDRQVTWTGMLGGDLKWGAFHAAEAFVLPSHQENFGVSVVEALACGRPVLISDQVNIWRQVSADGAGLVEKDDLAGTIRLLERWLSLDSVEQERMAARAKSCFEQRFHMAKVARDFVLATENSI